MSEHLVKVNALLERARGYHGLEESEVAVLADEVVRLRRVIAQLAPFMGRAMEEALMYAEELDECGVDPCEPALAELDKALGRLAQHFAPR